MPILSRASSSLMFSLQVLLVSTSLLSAALMLKFSVPAITEFAVHEVPSIINGVVSWFKPPYLYLVINCIIITILASSKFQSKNDEVSRPLPSPPPPLETAAHIQSQLPVMPIAENLHQDEYKYDDVVLCTEEMPECYVNDIIDSNNGFSHVEAGVLGDETVFNMNADSIEEDATSNKENQFVISKSRWIRKDMPEYSFSNEKPRPPPVSERFGSRRNFKASPEDMALLAICYFGEFKKNDQGQWTWKWNGDNGESVAALVVSENTSYTELYNEIGNLLIFDSSEYEMEFGFLFPNNTNFPVPPERATYEQTQRSE
ncbi:hypothetical protein Fot_48363 [Forsythia ovata]|uniref:DUF4408 domain-containing protein n=1 Tax=Forsythia ovata TaxID=205694 RepID=A0ABD1Q9Z8_9LAMI